MNINQYLSITFTNEDHFIISTNRYINANYPELRHLYFHVPNESSTNAITRIKLFNTGVLAGVPDLCFIFPYLWFMELKMPNGAVSPKQKQLHELWRNNGIIVEVCRTAHEVVESLNKHVNIIYNGTEEKRRGKTGGRKKKEGN